MKKIVYFVWLLSLLTITCEKEKHGLRDGEIALVDQRTITHNEFQGVMQNLILTRQFVSTGNVDADFEELKKFALNKVIERKLVLERAEKSDTEVNEEAVKNQLYQYQKLFKSDQEYWEYLDSIHMDEDDLRQEIFENLLIDNFLTKKFETAYENISKEISEEEIQEYYDLPNRFLTAEQVKLRHIFFDMPRSTPADEQSKTRARAERVWQQAKAGKDFAALAKRFSEDSTTAEKGGDLGLVARTRMETEFDAAAFVLKKGEISDIVQTREGLHIIKLEERQKRRKVALQKVRAMVVNLIIKEREQQMFREYVEELRKSAVIVVTDSLKQYVTPDSGSQP